MSKRLSSDRGHSSKVSRMQEEELLIVDVLNLANMIQAEDGAPADFAEVNDGESHEGNQAEDCELEDAAQPTGSKKPQNWRHSLGTWNDAYKKYEHLQPSPKDRHHFRCTVCHVDISFGKKGEGAIMRHVSSQKHYNALTERSHVLTEPASSSSESKSEDRDCPPSDHHLEPVHQASHQPLAPSALLESWSKTSARPIVVSMKRTEFFSAAHRLHSDKLSGEENAAIFGKCNNSNGHGHNYTVDVVLEGPVDETTGMVYNLSDLKRQMQEVIDMVDHKNLDLDVEYFKNGIVSTTENVCVFFFNELRRRLQDPELLKEVTVHETSKNSFTFCG